MRIVSQGGRLDIPYENNCLEYREIQQNGQYMNYDIVLEKRIIGEYSSKEKALKVMEMIRSRYRYILTLTKQDIQKLNANHIVKVIDANYFHMPQDNEVE